MARGLAGFVVMLVPVVALAQASEPEPAGQALGIDLAVTAKSGLKLKESTAKGAADVATIPKGAVVALQEVDFEPRSIKGKTGFWARVAWSGKEGWAFSRFLKKKRGHSVLQGTSAILAAGIYAEGEKAELVVDELAGDLGYSKGKVTAQLMASPVAQSTIEIRGFKSKPKVGAEPRVVLVVKIEKVESTVTTERLESGDTATTAVQRVLCKLLEEKAMAP